MRPPPASLHGARAHPHAAALLKWLASAAVMLVALPPVEPRAACPQLTWSPPTPLFAPQPGRAVRGFDLIETPDHRVHAVWGWSEGTGEASKLYWSTQESGAWSAPQLVDPTGIALVEVRPLLAVGEDVLDRDHGA